MSCRFFGKSATSGHLLESNLHNECALMLIRHARCGMDRDGQPPNELTCPVFHDGQRVAALFEVAAEPAGVKS